MSHHLPAHPNLEYLKKQAKTLLSELRRQNSGAKLADAQHAVAREYGFVNWPQLKAHVESLSAPADGAGARPVAEDENPFVGRWEADLSKSIRHPLNQYKAATLQFAVDGDIVTIDDAVVDASGRTEHTRNTIRTDGRERLAEHGYSVTARWRGARVLEAVVTKDGQIEGRVHYEISSDARTLTVTASEQVGVFDRR